jgi:hypothetical protein
MSRSSSLLCWGWYASLLLFLNSYSSFGMCYTHESGMWFCHLVPANLKECKHMDTNRIYNNGRPEPPESVMLSWCRHRWRLVLVLECCSEPTMLSRTFGPCDGALLGIVNRIGFWYPWFDNELMSWIGFQSEWAPLVRAQLLLSWHVLNSRWSEYSFPCLIIIFIGWKLVLCCNWWSNKYSRHQPYQALSMTIDNDNSLKSESCAPKMLTFF